MSCALSIHQKECQKSLGCALYIRCTLSKNTVHCLCHKKVFIVYCTYILILSVYALSVMRDDGPKGLKSIACMKIQSCVRQYLTVYSFNVPARLRSVMEKEKLQKLILESTYPPVPFVLGSFSPGVERLVQEAKALTAIYAEVRNE